MAEAASDGFESSEAKACPPPPLAPRKEAIRERRCRALARKRSVLGKLNDELKQLEASLAVANPVAAGSTPAAVAPAKAEKAASSVVVAAKARVSLRHDASSSTQAREEAHVLSKIAFLQKEGLWMGKKPPKMVAEPARTKLHWDYVLEEMTWLASVVQQELKTRKIISRKCAKMVSRHFQEKAQASSRAEKTDEQQKRRLASFIAKEIRSFWMPIEKLFELRLNRQIEAKRKQALDEHLNFIVDKTEKYSSMLAESLAESSMRPTPAASDIESISSGTNVDDDEYKPDQSSDDDEATITKDDDRHEADEVDLLKEESDIPVEELLRKFHPELYQESEQDGAGEAPKESSTAKRRNKRTMSAREEEEDDEEDSSPLKKLMSENENEESGFYNAIEMAEKFKPTGNTLDTTVVKTPIPFLLKGQLREYQHVGLDWLVSLHETKFNGILADEMGLGKTIQTIALLAHLACTKGIWGPHLIVVPTSVMINWEMELKKWCSAFKVLTYYGSQKERKLKRVGWTKQNAFHVCVTSYKLVIQDHQSFRRKQWYYFILDEAQHIKNFKSKRWQLLLNFQSRGRLLLTGTPLQNNLMELWSLMHFLMPDVFQSHRDFKEWFSNPLTGMVEDSIEYNENLVRRLHKVLRPFLLRRLKNEVEKQLPKKYEHVVYCPLSKRQRFLYDDFMSRDKTQESLAGGNANSVMNILMQLRKVCNHPNLFEPRPTQSPFVAATATASAASRLVLRMLESSPLDRKSLDYAASTFVTHELTQTAYGAHAAARLQPAHADSALPLVRRQQPPACPRAKFRISVSRNVAPKPQVGANDFISISTVITNKIWIKKKADVNIKTDKGTFLLTPATLPRFPEQFDECNNSLVDVAVSDSQSEDERGGIFKSAQFQRSFRTFVSADADEQLLQVASRSIEINRKRLGWYPLYGRDVVSSLSVTKSTPFRPPVGHCSTADRHQTAYSFRLMRPLDSLTFDETKFLCKFHLYVPPVLVSPESALPSDGRLSRQLSGTLRDLTFSQFNLQLPEARLIQYDCGKLQTLAGLLNGLRDGGHRVLLFTQMTGVLDILESFLNYHGHTYLRLDGSTKVEQRQALTERFNGSNKYFCFILSTRSGGVGINLTGADTVIFYDCDWNPTMDAQAQDRCHRIGQTRDVHIYKLVSERTVEENVLRKANQKRLLNNLVIEGGNFTTAFFKSQAIRDLFSDDSNANGNENDEEEDVGSGTEVKRVNVKAFENAIAAVEDTTDMEAMVMARREAAAEEAEFEEIDKIIPEDDDISQLISQMSPIERYALSHIEYVESAWKEGQIRAAEGELMAQKEELEKASIEEDILKRRSQLGTGSAPDSAEDDEDSEEEDDDDEDDDEEDGSDEEEEEDSEEESEEEKEVASKKSASAVHSPLTRSRGDVRINLWKLNAL